MPDPHATHTACPICGVGGAGKPRRHARDILCRLCGCVMHPAWERPYPGLSRLCLDCAPRLGLPDLRPRPKATDAQSCSPFAWPRGQAFS